MVPPTDELRRGNVRLAAGGVDGGANRRQRLRHAFADEDDPDAHGRQNADAPINAAIPFYSVHAR
jgi:hypothetical protein